MNCFEACYVYWLPVWLPHCARHSIIVKGVISKSWKCTCISIFSFAIKHQCISINRSNDSIWANGRQTKSSLCANVLTPDIKPPRDIELITMLELFPSVHLVVQSHFTDQTTSKHDIIHNAIDSIYHGYIWYDIAYSTTIDKMVRFALSNNTRNSPLRASYEVFFVSYTKKIDCDISRAHCNRMTSEGISRFFEENISVLIPYNVTAFCLYPWSCPHKCQGCFGCGHVTPT